MNTDDILAVLVLYNCKLEESETFLSLSKALKYSNLKIDLLVYDNSPESHFDKNVELGYSGSITYIHDSNNPGICKAYNTGFEKALAINKKWLLLLDQDTEITLELLKGISQYAHRSSCYVAIIPIVCSNERIVSPSRSDFMGRLKPILRNEANGLLKNITGINSGACLKIDFLNQIKGFTKEYPLDMLDHWFFREVNSLGKTIYVLNTELKHDLSVMNFQKQISAKRYYSILQAERRFYNESFKELVLYKARLFLRGLKQVLYKDKKMFLMSFKFLFRKVR